MLPTSAIRIDRTLSAPRGGGVSGRSTNTRRWLVAHDSRGSGVAQAGVDAISSEQARRIVEKAMPLSTVTVVGREGDAGK